jgi:hypothetical protein
MISPKLGSSICLVALVASAASATAQPPAPFPACPAPDPAARAAAHGAVSLIAKLGPELGRDVLSPSLYQLSSSGRGIEFNPAVAGVTNEAKAALAFAQVDDAVGDFLRRGQAFCELNSQGFYLRLSSEALDVAASRSQPWCGATLVSRSVVTASRDGNPFVSRAAPSADRFKPNAARAECSPFFGPSQKNDFLLVTLSSVTKGDRAVHTLAMDPVGYMTAADVCNPVCLQGTEDNPFTIDGDLIADAYHQGNWAQVFENGVCDMGTFSIPWVKNGVTRYRWQKVDGVSCPAQVPPPGCTPGC